MNVALWRVSQVPPEARLGGGGSSAESALAWNEFAAADAADWDNFDDEGTAPLRAARYRAMVHHACKRLACRSVPTA